MRTTCWLTLVVIVSVAIGYGLRSPSAPETRQVLAAEKEAPGDGFEVVGKTQPAEGRVAKIAPAVLHPVVEVKVKLGDKVKKEQALVLIDDDEPKADVRAKEAALKELQTALERLKVEPRQEEKDEAKAALEACESCCKQAQKYFDRVKPLWEQGA